MSTTGRPNEEGVGGGVKKEDEEKQEEKEGMLNSVSSTRSSLLIWSPFICKGRITLCCYRLCRCLLTLYLTELEQ